MKRSRQRIIATTLGTMLVLFVINWFTQPFEDAISTFPRGGPFYRDYVWYLDDLLGPALFIAGGLGLLAQVGMAQVRRLWPVTLLAALYIVLGLGDTVDAHWVVTVAQEASDEVKSFGSFGSKILSVLTLGYALIYAWEHLSARAAKALLFAFLLITIDQIHMAVALEFAGFAFHVFEESVEVVAGLFLLYAVTGPALRETS